MKLRILIFLLCTYGCICLHTFPTSEMCPKGLDCSFQIPNASANACSIYHTEECREYNFSSWNLKPLVVPSSEYDAPFYVSLFPYAAIVNKLLTDSPLSGMNMTLTILNQGITGFSVILKEDFLPKYVCRVFDFRSSSNFLHIPMTFFYDCFTNLVEHGVQNVTMIFTTYPVNVELSYLVFIPHIKNHESVCEGQWQPLVMIYKGSLEKNFIQMKFSPALEYMDVQFYLITLLDSSNKKVKSMEIPGNNIKNMMFSEFTSIKDGYYYLSINISTKEDSSCLVFKSNAVFVGRPSKGDSTVVYLVILCILLVITVAAILIYHCYHSDRLLASSSSNLKLLIIHSPDCVELNDFVLSVMDYLKLNYRITVYSSHRLGAHSSHKLDFKPTAWLTQKYDESDVIVFVISEGLFHVLQRNNKPPQDVKHSWKEQVSVAVSHIEYVMHSERSTAAPFWHLNSKRNKKFCMISFPFSGKHHIPNRLKYMEPFFMLPRDEDKFYQYIFGYTSVITWFRNYRVVRRLLKMKSDENIDDHLKNMMDAVSAGRHIHYIKSSDEDKDLNIKSDLRYNFDISLESNNFISPNDDNFHIKDELKHPGDKLPNKDLAALNVNINHTDDNSSKNDIKYVDYLTSVLYCDNEQQKETNPQFSRLNSDSSNLENKDWMEHFVKKDFSWK